MQDLYTDWQKKRYNQNQGSFIQASNYVEINQQITRSIMFWRNLELCAAVPSKRHKPRPKSDVTDAKCEFLFPDTLNDKEGTR